MGGTETWIRPDQRAGRWAQRESRRRQWDVVRKNWGRLILAPAVFGVVGFAAGIVIGGWSGGCLSGVAITASVGVPTYVLAISTGAAPRSMGAFAEQETSAALRKGLPKPWRTFDRVALKGRDIDHLVVGPGRALAVETKWSGDPWDLEDLGDDRLVRAAQQAVSGQRQARTFLRSSQFRLPLEVDPLVVVVGRVREVEGSFEVDGVPVVHVARLKQWIADWAGRDRSAVVSDEDLAAGAARIDAYLEVRDEHDAEQDPESFFVVHGALAPAQAVWQGAIGFLAGAVVPLLVATPILHQGWLGIGAIYLASLVGWLVLRKLGRRAVAVGWGLAGVGLVIWLVVLVLTNL